MIYFDTEHEAYQQRETIEKWGKTYLTECTEEEYLELQEGKKMWDNGKIVVNPNYEEEQKQKEHERLNMLSMTKREMFLGLYQAKQITPDMLKAKISEPTALIEFEYANDYYRGNPLIDVIGIQLGFTTEQLDKFFETKDYTYLLPSEQVEDETEQVTEQVEESEV